jgi:hypothetical protein
MKTSTFPRAARFGLIFCLALLAVLACGAPFPNSLQSFTGESP